MFSHNCLECTTLWKLCTPINEVSISTQIQAPNELFLSPSEQRVFGLATVTGFIIGTVLGRIYLFFAFLYLYFTTPACPLLVPILGIVNLFSAVVTCGAIAEERSNSVTSTQPDATDRALGPSKGAPEDDSTTLSAENELTSATAPSITYGAARSVVSKHDLSI